MAESTLMGRLARILAVTVTLLGGCTTEAAADCKLLVDNSGSMSGFQSAGAPQQTFGRLVHGLAGLCVEAFVFSAGPPTPADDPAKVPANAQTTKLDEAFDWWKHGAQGGDALLMLTDNVADDHMGIESDAQERFNRALRSDNALSGAEVHVIVLPFSGPVYYLDKRPGRPEWYNDPRGRAVALYFVVQATESKERDHVIYKVLRDRLDGIIRGALPFEPQQHHRFTVRPFEALETNVAPASSKNDLIVAAGGSSVSGATSQFDPVSRILTIANLPIDTPLSAIIQLGVKSGPDFRVKDVQVNAEFTTSASTLVFKKSTSATINSAQRFELRAGKNSIVTIHVPLPVFDWTDHPSVFERIRRIFAKRAPVLGQIQVTYTVQRHNIKLEDDRRAQWSTNARDRLGSADPEVQTRIYRLEDVLQGIAAPEGGASGGVLNVPLDPLKVRIYVVGSPRDTIALLILIIVAFLVLAGLLYYFSRGQDYEFSGFGGARKLRMGFFGSHQIQIAGGVRATVHKVGPIVVVAWRGPSVTPLPTLLGPNGGTSRAGPAGPTLTIRRPNRPRSAARPSFWPFGPGDRRKGNLKP